MADGGEWAAGVSSPSADGDGCAPSSDSKPVGDAGVYLVADGCKCPIASWTTVCGVRCGGGWEGADANGAARERVGAHRRIYHMGVIRDARPAFREQISSSGEQGAFASP
jgi:hypothetical protein